MTPENSNNPFLHLKVRSLLLRLLLIFFILGLGLGIIQATTGVQFHPQVLNLILYIFVFGLLCLWTLADFKRFRIHIRYFVGRLPNNHRWLPMVGLVIVLILFSIGSYLVLFYLLSLAAPSFVDTILREAAKSPTPQKTAPLLSNLLGAIVLVVVAPLTEEFLFRGIILQRWASKWGIRAGLISSSLLFGIGHTNVVGLSMVGMILGVLYIRTRSLMVPIACHAINNSFVVVMTLLSNESNNTVSVMNELEQVRHSLWLGIVLILLSLPVLVRFLSQNWPRKDENIPYFINSFEKES
ncbi:type II CAAX endopeptidase family protein [Brasilonema sp. UFV-L1]|uniref:CPBP family intramembrane glutamic endopeptidase n=1 Tax=Brasilonema sp. UFV-L1 TaxID=2234130 RepID=UPI00145D05EF|nr:type II CAAX endopeptidase family protein [Brasilonema sp. UFV-L1]NMG07004.1 CPBP family intramembrane metalloprotease [Brasilonema sp. UFV-L1]